MTKFLAIHKEPIDNLVFTKLGTYGEVASFDGSAEPTDYTMVVMDAKSCSPDYFTELLPVVQVALDNNVAVMLLDAGVEHKKALSPCLGCYNERTGVAFFIAPMADKNGKRHYKFIEQFAPVTPKEGLVRQEVSIDFNGEQVLGEPVEVDLSDAPDAVLTAEHIVEFTAEVKTDLTLLASSGVLEQEGDAPPAGAPYWKHLYKYKQPYTLGGGASRGHTPPAANQLLSGNTTIGIYYDNKTFTNQPIQWVFLEVSGVYAANLTADTQYEKGWMVGGLQVDGPSPTYLTYKQASPNSVSGSTTFTAETSFTVGLEAGKDGISINASYTETNSTTKTLTDWEIVQLNEDAWKFFQQVPFNGTVMADLSKGLNGSGIVALPSISTSSLAYNTQTVWQAEPPQTTNKSIPYTIIVWPYFLWTYDPGKSWKGAHWGWPNGYTLLSDNWTANFSQALPS